MERVRARGRYAPRSDGDMMRGVFGGMPSGVQYNQDKRASLDGLAARQQAVALAFERQQREKEQMRVKEKVKEPTVPETGMFPSISPRSVPPPYPPAVGNPVGYGMRPPKQQQQQGQQVDVKSRIRIGNDLPEPTRGTSDSDSKKIYELLSSISSRLNSNDDSVSSLRSHLSSLHNGHSSMEMKVSSLPTMNQLSDLKQQLESNTVLMNEAAKKSNEAMMEANKLGLQLYEQNTQLNQLSELGKDFEKSSMLLDSLRLTVDEIKSSQPMIKSIDNEISNFRREFHARLADDSEFRDSVNKKNQVLFNELVRLGEGVEKDRGNSRIELKEMAGILTGIEKRVKNAEEGLDRTTKAHGGKLVNIDASVNTMENAIQSFGRDLQQIVGSLGEERKSRKNSVDNLTTAMDEIRGAVSDRLQSAVSNIDGKMGVMEEHIRSNVDSVRSEGERGRSLIMEEVRSVAKSVGDEAASRAALGSSLGIQINNVVEGGKEDVARLRSDVNDQIDRMKTEENELVTQNIKRQEELKAVVAQLEREVFETHGAVNARVDRTRAALEEVIRAEIQSRQSNFSNLEGRVRDIVTDCMTSLESVSKESRMAVDALVNRVNTLEVNMTSVIDGKIMVVEEAVAARQNEQENVNSSFHKDIADIRDFEEQEHTTRVQKENEIVDRVTVVEDRVEGEIDDVRQRVERARAETTEQVRAMEDAVTRRCDTTDENVGVLKNKAEENEINIESLTATTNNNFDMVREDAIKTKGKMKLIEKEVGEVDDKISVNNVITSGVDQVVGSIEKEEKARDEALMKRYFEDYVRESERKLVEKEEEREKLMEQQFQERMKSMEEEHVKSMEILQKKFHEELAEEKRLEAQANKAIKKELFEAVENDRVMSVVGFVVADTVGKVVELAKDEEIAEAGRVARAERERLEVELKMERERSKKVGEKLEKLEDIVEEREKLEKLEWNKILESSFLSGEGGGERGEENGDWGVGDPVVGVGEEFPPE